MTRPDPIVLVVLEVGEKGLGLLALTGAFMFSQSGDVIY